MTELIIFGIMFLAMFIEGNIGFGSALITMPILIQQLGIKTAPPVFALVALSTNILMVLRYREHWNLQAIRWILLASLPAIPLGIGFAGLVAEHLAMLVLGLIVIGYALYALFSPRIPEIKDDRWGAVAGFISGLMYGAYTVAGPPLVIFGNARRWEPKEFKSNLQSIFIINGVLIVVTHLLRGSITPAVGRYYLVMVPGAVSGLLLGFWMDRYINPVLFRRAVLILLIFVGLSLVF